MVKKIKYYKPIIQYPDVQGRIIKNIPEIKYVNKIHEVLDGIKLYSVLPLEEDYSLYHHKTIERQRKQNQLYDEIQ